jgi:DNA mismatch repair protein MutL
MSQIKLLDPLVRNQIAAGEVVERPAAIIKELVENSIDAGATRISIELSHNYRSIKIADNGKGIYMSELELAFERHATSKISEITDLNDISSNGFRGEALASIAAVSKVTCISKPADQELAYSYTIKGVDAELNPASAASGTSILIEELFYNTPARLKFLKTGASEKKHIVDLVRNFAIFHPKIAFKLTIDHGVTLDLNQQSDFSLRIKDIFGDKIVSKLIPLSYHAGNLQLTGFISTAALFRSDKRAYYTAINTRVVPCDLIRSAVDKIYKEILPARKYPYIFLNILIEADQVDVNVHPSKKEVRYQNPNYIYRSLLEALRVTLADEIFKEHAQLKVFNSESLLTATELNNLLENESGVKASSKLEAEIVKEKLESNKEKLNEISGAKLTNESEKVLNQPSENISDLKQDTSGSSKTYVSQKSTCKSTYAPYQQDYSLNSDPNCKPKIKLAHQANRDSNLAESNLKANLSDLSDLELKPNHSFNELKVSRLNISFIDSPNLKTVILNNGIRTNFEIVSEINKSNILINGELSSSNSKLKQNFLEHLQKFADEHAGKISASNFAANKINKNERSRPDSRISDSQLAKIFKRDNYTCVYCGRPLINNKTLKQALASLPLNANTKLSLDSKNKLTKQHKLNDYKATYDHHLPASKYAALNQDERNLYAACPVCNLAKSNSEASKTWQPKMNNAWQDVSEDQPLEIEGVKFVSPYKFIANIEQASKSNLLN